MPLSCRVLCSLDSAIYFHVVQLGVFPVLWNSCTSAIHPVLSKVVCLPLGHVGSGTCLSVMPTVTDAQGLDPLTHGVDCWCITSFLFIGWYFFVKRCLPSHATVVWFPGSIVHRGKARPMFDSFLVFASFQDHELIFIILQRENTFAHMPV